MITPDPVVSIIILTYNQENTVGRTIDSILRQHIPVPYEIVIGEDASTDSTRTVCMDYAQRYPAIVRLMPEAPNKGLVRNYFDCVTACKGRFITDCAGDDEYMGTDSIHRMLELLRANPGAAAVAADWVKYYPHTGMQELIKVHPPRTVGEALLSCKYLGIMLSAMLYRAAPIKDMMASHPHLLQGGGFRCEDLPMFVALTRLGGFVHLPYPVYRYSIYEGSVSNPSSVSDTFHFMVHNAECTWQMALGYNISPVDYERPMRPMLEYMTLLAFRSGSAEYARIAREASERYGIKLRGIPRMKAFAMRHILLWHILKKITPRRETLLGSNIGRKICNLLFGKG
ncbi:MAG: glycosyltransferase family 2 protein [Muribaculaceae bacterium]|nr:glycosyltransferase family 2 protein [Muribaculaceae bacterium]